MMKKIVGLIWSLWIILGSTSLFAADTQINFIALMEPLKRASENDLKKSDISKLVLHINNNFGPALDKLSESELKDGLNQYVILVGKYKEQSLFEKTTGILECAVKASQKVEIVEIADFNDINIFISSLQSLKRVIKSYHDEIIDPTSSERFFGNIRLIVQKFANGSWSDKASSVLNLAKLVPEHNDKVYIKTAAEKTGVFLASYAYYLSASDLYLVLHAFILLNKKDEFVFVNKILDQIINIEGPISNTDIRAQESKIIVENYASSLKRKDSNNDHDKHKFALSRNISKKEGSVELKKIITEKTLKLVIDTNKKEEKFTVKIPINEGIGKHAQLLQKFSLFSKINKDLILLFARITQFKRLEDNQTLYQEQEPGDSFALILDGELDIYINQNKIKTLIKGQSVGEISLFVPDAKRSATVKANGYVQLLEIKRDDFQKFVNIEPLMLRVIFYQLLSKADESNHNVAKLFSYENLNILSENLGCLGGCVLGSKSANETYQSGEIIIEKGHEATCLFLVVEGQVGLFSDKGRVGVLGEGDFCDEIAVLQEKGRYFYTARAESNCTILEISKNNLCDTIYKKPELICKLAAAYSKLITQNNIKLTKTSAYILQQACMDDSGEKARVLIEEGVTINDVCPVPDDMGMGLGTRFTHAAAKYGSKNVFQLFKNKANFNAVDDLGNTPAHIAALENQLGILKMLKEFGAVLNAKNIMGDTPLKIAQDLHHQDIINFLKSEKLETSESSNFTDSSS